MSKKKTNLLILTMIIFSIISLFFLRETILTVSDLTGYPILTYPYHAPDNSTAVDPTAEQINYLSDKHGFLILYLDKLCFVEENLKHTSWEFQFNSKFDIVSLKLTENHETFFILGTIILNATAKSTHFFMIQFRSNKSISIFQNSRYYWIGSISPSGNLITYTSDSTQMRQIQFLNHSNLQYQPIETLNSKLNEVDENNAYYIYSFIFLPKSDDILLLKKNQITPYYFFYEYEYYTLELEGYIETELNYSVKENLSNIFYYSNSNSAIDWKHNLLYTFANQNMIWINLTTWELKQSSIPVDIESMEYHALYPENLMIFESDSDIIGISYEIFADEIVLNKIFNVSKTTTFPRYEYKYRIQIHLSGCATFQSNSIVYLFLTYTEIISLEEIKSHPYVLCYNYSTDKMYWWTTIEGKVSGGFKLYKFISTPIPVNQDGTLYYPNKDFTEINRYTSIINDIDTFPTLQSSDQYFFNLNCLIVSSGIFIFTTILFFKEKRKKSLIYQEMNNK